MQQIKTWLHRIWHKNSRLVFVDNQWSKIESLVNSFSTFVANRNTFTKFSQHFDGLGNITANTLAVMGLCGNGMYFARNLCKNFTSLKINQFRNIVFLGRE